MMAVYVWRPAREMESAGSSPSLLSSSVTKRSTRTIQRAPKTPPACGCGAQSVRSENQGPASGA